MSRLENLMDICGFKKPGDSGIYKYWGEYLDEVAAYAVRSTRKQKRKAMVLIGIYVLFIEYLAGRLPDTLDEATDGATYMSRAALEFKDRFISATQEHEEDE